jgi:butyryl-CoA dehydrogenase
VVAALLGDVLDGGERRAVRGSSSLLTGMCVGVPRGGHRGTSASVRRMDFDLTDEQQLIRETARDFTDKEIVPRARENDRNHHFDLDLIAQIAAQGYLGAIVPREYGGAGLDYVTYGLIVEEVGRGDSAMRTVVSVQTSLVCSSLVRWGTEEQKQRYLPNLCSGEWLGCFGLTEPDTGSDAANQRTRARKTDSGWVLNGNKMWISMGNHAKLALIFAQTDPELRHRGLGCFLVETDTPGFSTQEIHGKMGLHGSDTASLALDDVEVPEEALMGQIGDGFKVAMSALDSGRYSVAAGCVGICQGSLDASVAYSKERRQFDRPIASFQLVQAMIADMRVQTDAARMLTWRAGFLKDKGRPSTTETSIAKLYATEAAQNCSHLAIQVHGGSGYVDDHPVERYFRDVRVTTLYEGTSQIQKLIIGRAETGINALVP